MVSINVPPPQLWGGQHTEMFVDHVTVFSQSVSHIRLSHTIFILYCMAMRGIPEYIAQARTILHASVGQVQYGPSAGNIFWYLPNIKPCNIIIIIHNNSV